MSLPFNMLSRLVIAFLARSKFLWISWLQSPSAGILEPPNIKSVTVSIVSPSICHKVMGPDDLHFLNVEFLFFFFFECWVLSHLFHYFTFVRRLFGSSSLSAIRVTLSAYQRLLIFLPGILIPVCASSSLTFLMMHCTYNLNNQDDNVQPWYTLFPIWNKSVVPCSVLTVASWSTYRFLRRQVRYSGIPISWRIFHSLLWPTQLKTLA